MLIPPQLSSTVSLTVLLVNRELEQMTILFRSTACSVMSHGWPAIASGRLTQIYIYIKKILPITFWLSICYILLFVHWFRYNIIWRLIMCMCCLFRCRIKLKQQWVPCSLTLTRSIFITVVCTLEQLSLWCSELLFWLGLKNNSLSLSAFKYNNLSNWLHWCIYFWAEIKYCVLLHCRSKVLLTDYLY